MRMISLSFVALVGAVATASFVVAAPAALAHGSMKPRHGGQVQMSGETLFELVGGARAVDLYVLEDDEPIAASGYTAKLVISAGAKKSEAVMRPVSGNRFTAAGVKLPRGAKVGVLLVNAGSKARTFATFLVR